ncbi:DUF742 domain-containing protein [Streptomyces pilosus]|uniref:DUF742 domain-containing protein n=1 Tax=Streptomyces pilosus TaxID=28893 RepID=A0A918C0B4_9ACTN|nr:DUF742 domain-containing protein [Streptomyces pilosus]GGQ97902.1 hypothetical protein GCM10010280_51830 [Streptomyces pilosus]GGV61860.1 hypothetical protein GCM10010261_50950 [Streptomyces pilosus]
MTPPKRLRRTPLDGPPPQPAAPAGRKGGGGNPERLYVVAGPDGERADLDLVTLIVARSPDPPPSATPEQAALLRLCVAPLSVAELSAYLNLPFGVVTVLLTEMLTAELVQARSSIVREALPDRSLLEAVMHGLQRL